MNSIKEQNILMATKNMKWTLVDLTLHKADNRTTKVTEWQTRNKRICQSRSKDGVH